MEKVPFQVDEIRKQFPALHQNVYGKALVYLDNAATTQKPQAVINRLTDYYTHENCNIHRGVHYLSQQATSAFEQARITTAKFINAAQAQEVVFTKGTTESVNLIASSLGKLLMKSGDKVLITGMEHHSNLVPWQQLCKDYHGELLVANLTDSGETDLDHFAELLKQSPKIVAISHISNALGSINPIKEMIALAHQLNIPVLVDGAQSVAHMKIDVQDFDCDFFVFSGHKIYAPMGVGVLYGKRKWLEQMPPWQYGGEMVDQVSYAETTFNELPFKFEAGTPNVGAVLGLATALEYLSSFDIELIAEHELLLVHKALEALQQIDGMRLIGSSAHRAGVVSFVVDGIHPYDIGTLIDKMGIAVRTGHHCAQTVMTRYKLVGTVRASFAMYNNTEDLDRFVLALKKSIEMLR